MPILAKGDDVQSGTKANAYHTHRQLQATQAPIYGLSCCKLKL